MFAQSARGQKVQLRCLLTNVLAQNRVGVKPPSHFLSTADAHGNTAELQQPGAAGIKKQIHGEVVFGPAQFANQGPGSKGMQIRSCFSTFFVAPGSRVLPPALHTQKVHAIQMRVISQYHSVRLFTEVAQAQIGISRLQRFTEYRRHGHVAEVTQTGQ